MSRCLDFILCQKLAKLYKVNMYLTRCADEVKMNYLEVDSSLTAKKPDIYNVVNSNPSSTHSSSKSSEQHCTNSSNDTFVDDPEVPPLI